MLTLRSFKRQLKAYSCCRTNLVPVTLLSCAPASLGFTTDTTIYLFIYLLIDLVLSDILVIVVVHRRRRRWQ